MVTVPNIFAGATQPISLAQFDANWAALNPNTGNLPYAFTPTVHPNQGGVSGANYVRTDQNAAFNDIDQISIVSKDPTTAPNNWTVSGTVATNDIVNLKITYTPQGGSQKTVTISVTVTAAISGASGGSPFVLNGFSATNPQYAVCLQMQQNFRTNATLLADFGAAFIAPSSFTLLNIALNNFPSAGTSTFQFNFRYPEVATAGTTFQATVTTGAETVTPSASTTITNALENNPYYSVGRTVPGVVPPVSSFLGSFYSVGDDSLGSGTLNTQYMNLITRVDSPTNGAWQSTVVLGSGNWPLGTGSAALALGRGLYLGSANVFPIGSDPGANNVNIAGQYRINNGIASAGPSGQFGGAASGINLNAAAAPAAIAGTMFDLVQVDGTVGALLIDSFAAASSLFLRRADGTNASKAALALNDLVGTIEGYGFDGTSYSPIVAGIRMRATEAWGAAAHGTRLQFNMTPATTTTIGLALEVTALAGVIANQLQVNAAPAGTGPNISVIGTDTNADFGVIAKGTGVVNLGTTTATTATAGAQTLPANPAGFINIKVNGTAQKIPFYNT